MQAQSGTVWQHVEILLGLQMPKTVYSLGYATKVRAQQPCIFLMMQQIECLHSHEY